MDSPTNSGMDPFDAFACTILEVETFTEDEIADVKVKIGTQIADDTCEEHREFMCPKCFDT